MNFAQLRQTMPGFVQLPPVLLLLLVVELLLLVVLLVLLELPVPPAPPVPSLIEHAVFMPKSPAIIVPSRPIQVLFMEVSNLKDKPARGPDNRRAAFVRNAKFSFLFHDKN